MRDVRVPSRADLAAAEAVVRAHLRPTPVIPDDSTGDVVLKLENWQPTGSFKVRGALAAMAALTEDARAAGVVTASAGNHGLGVAHAAQRLGIPATVVVPTTASAAKVDALRQFDINLMQRGDDYFDAEQHALSLAEHGPTYISAYNDPLVIAGQASVAAELGEQVGTPLTIVVPIGGGGLAAGVCLWAADRGAVRVIGVEAAASRAVSAAVAAGHVVEVEVEPTLADGLAGNIEPGSVTPQLIREHAADLVSVSESQIRDAMRHLAVRHGLVVEGSGAVGVAAVHAGVIPVNGRTAVVITGRNVTLPVLSSVFADGH